MAVNKDSGEDTIRGCSEDTLKKAKEAYMLPNNHDEILRMRNQHEWLKGSFGCLIKAPFLFEKKGQSILDSAAADGTWLCDVSTLLDPQTELVGFDIAPELFPPQGLLPPNVKLVTADLYEELPAALAHHFDLVHQRFVFPGFPRETVQQFIARLMGCVKPGGWIQFVEPVADEMISGPEPVAFNVLHELASLCMKTPNSSSLILSKLKEGGFVNINVEYSDFVIGKYQHNKELSERGRKSMRDSVKNMSSMVTPEVLRISQEEYDSLLDRFDADTEKYRTAVRHVMIWAQRPE